MPAASWAGRRSSSRRPPPEGPDNAQAVAQTAAQTAAESTELDRSVTPSDLDAMDTVDAPLTLRDLAALARREGGDAPEALLGRVRQLALRYARARLGRFGAEDAAQDVAQEVCMAVHSGLRTYDDRGLPFEAFVYAIAARKVADAQRRLIRGPESVAEVPDASDPMAGPEQLALVRDEASRAMVLIRTLPTPQQEILILRVAVGLSTDETAAAVGMTPGAIRVAQHRALTTLRELLAAAEVEAS